MLLNQNSNKQPRSCLLSTVFTSAFRKALTKVVELEIQPPAGLCPNSLCGHCLASQVFVFSEIELLIDAFKAVIKTRVNHQPVPVSCMRALAASGIMAGSHASSLASEWLPLWMAISTSGPSRGWHRLIGPGPSSHVWWQTPSLTNFSQAPLYH